MEKQIDRGLIFAVRTPAINTKEYKGDDPKYLVMRDRTPGALGCYLSQVSIMKHAYEMGRPAGVLEDDLILCEDLRERMDRFQTFLNRQDVWDIVWLGGTYHAEPTWHKEGHTQLPQCDCTLNRDWEPTDDPHIVRTYGCWSTYAYVVNYESIPKILKMLDDNVHLSMGIDWEFILLQPKLKCFAFNPGMVRQYDNQSDIGTGVTMFSGFAKLGSHWYKDRL